VDLVAQAYVTAISRGDRAALLAVYPTAPAELLLGKRPAGATLRLIFLLDVRDARGWSEVVLTVAWIAHDGTEGKPERIVLNLEPSGDSWKIVANR
jgi:hypothetical protein